MTLLKTFPSRRYDTASSAPVVKVSTTTKNVAVADGPTIHRPVPTPMMAEVRTLPRT